MRQNGYYRVQLMQDDIKNLKWEIMLFDNETGFYQPGKDLPYEEFDMAAINETRIDANPFHN